MVREDVVVPAEKQYAHKPRTCKLYIACPVMKITRNRKQRYVHIKESGEGAQATSLKRESARAESWPFCFIISSLLTSFLSRSLSPSQHSSFSASLDLDCDDTL